MTDPNYTHWTLVVDRSGSMQSLRSDAQGAINKMMAEQRAMLGRLTLTLIQFDTVIETVQNRVDIRTAGDYQLVPRGLTALLDAVGKAIVDTGETLAALPEDERPGHVFVMIVTDGQENSSQEYSLDQVQALIKEQEERWGWVFAFFGAENAAAWGHAMGIRNTTQTANTPGSTYGTYAVASTGLGDVRRGGTYVAPEEVK